jgi:hypothetical protein
MVEGADLEEVTELANVIADKVKLVG